MDLLYVRTKLQAIVAQRLLADNILRRPFVLVELSQYSPREADPSTYVSYEPLQQAARRVWSDVTAKSFFRSFLTAWRGMVLARLSGGTVFTSSIDYYPFALALKLTPGTRLVTFDDGFANIAVGRSAYFSEQPLPGSGLKRRLLRFLLPRGAAHFVRSRSSRHFTIFPGRDNIVPAAKVEALRFDWAALLAEGDRQKLSRPVRAVLVGSKYDEWPEALDFKAIAQGMAGKVDLYIPHPRELSDLHPEISVRLSSPAEAALAYLAEQGPLRVYHFDSSVAHVLADHPRLQFHNIAPAWTLDQMKTVG